MKKTPNSENTFFAIFGKTTKNHLLTARNLSASSLTAYFFRYKKKREK
ncbi:hypothetical protein T4B_1946 [Trichinella pseudospiralis]|uniref:Uncharacterized protein n=1 Tax=Trichinella pseudospiralis TaxID=6337 RepID=A0A0V1GI86_TRIPS|nr:hypothetical protein T4B_1946 [Trichinella pseudospiralis]